ncbi:MAG TPA: lipocalin family protein [Ferruginibacter sp.]|nr:lipocalin family protein [Ferruginibacter sp.]
MKKTIIISALLLIASASIISCKKSSASTSLVGTWKSTSEKATSVDSTTTPVTVVTIDTTFTAAPYPLVITFNADGTFSAINDGSSTPELGTYFYGQGKLSIEDNGSSTPSIIGYTLVGNTFTLIQTESDPGNSSETVNIIFTKE